MGRDLGGFRVVFPLRALRVVSMVLVKVLPKRS